MRSSINKSISRAASCYDKTRSHLNIGDHTKLVVQGFTGKQGTFHAMNAIEYGTNIVGGTNPRKAGSMHMDRPVFATVADAMRDADANASVIYIKFIYSLFESKTTFVESKIHFLNRKFPCFFYNNA